MEVGAIAFFGVAGIQHVTATPAAAGFVITHICKNIIVDGAGLAQLSGLARSGMGRKLGRQTSDRNKLVGSEKFVALVRLQGSIFQARTLRS